MYIILNFLGTQRRNFRSIVQAIKAGIKIDAIFRKPQNEVNIAHLIPKNVLKSLKSIDNWGFDIFSVPSVGGGKRPAPLKWVLIYLLSRYNLLERFRISPSVLVAFAERLEHGYRKSLDKNEFSIKFFILSVDTVSQFFKLFLLTKFSIILITT